MSYHHNRILGRNSNGTIAMTTQPSNDSELQLYRVLQRANLLAYYDTFICQGGDDVQQLCEAGEEEFLEIMALVGMASKPLHVRRLQKALQEWITNPALFLSPVVAPQVSNSQSSPKSSAVSANSRVHSSPGSSNNNATTANNNILLANSNQESPQIVQNSPTGSGLMQPTFTGNLSTPSPNQFGNPASNLNEYSQPCSPISMTPVLTDSQIQRLAEAADSLVKGLPPMDLKPLMNGCKKRISKEIESIMTMPEEDAKRMDEIRKYAAIYGRFDCKRKPEKPLTLHEVSVNEAAAQICSKIPALLYRRDELFPLARRVVRNSGYQYSKGHSRSQSCSRLFDDHSSNDQTSVKRMRIDSSLSQESKNGINFEDRKRRYDRLEGIVDQLKTLGSKQEEIKNQIEEANERQNFQVVSQLQNQLEMIVGHHIQLVNEKVELENQQKQIEIDPRSSQNRNKMEFDKADTDDTDSQFSLYSNESTASILRESRQNSPNNYVPVTGTTADIFSSKSQTSNNKRKTSQANSANIANNSNDSNFASKHLLNDAIDEGLRVAKELGQVLDENIDLRLFNKYTEALRNSGCFANLAEVNNNSSNNNRPPKQDGPRPRGRPPKVVEHDIPNPFYEQILSQAQIQQHMLANYQTLHFQQSLQAHAALFGEFNLNSNNSTGAQSTNETETNCDKEMGGCNFSAINPENDSDNLTKAFNGNNNDGHDDSTKQCNIEMATGQPDKDEVTQSLSALISISNSGASMVNDSIKHELSMPSVEFKIA